MRDNDSLPSRRLALGCLFAVAVGFYASYGGANWLTSQREYVPEIAFAWEQHIPFWGWTIVPYWTLNAFYALAFFCCRSRRELWRYVQQLLLAQVIAVVCFVLFPLQFSWQKPAVEGVSAWLFQALGAFDQPYNQAPSLHIMLTLIVGHFYWRRFARWRVLMVVWFALIALSVLTTWQHHFIDIPTGVLAGAVVLWLRPSNHASPLITASKRLHSRCALFYAALSLFALSLMLLRGVWLWTAWPAVSCAVLMLAYAGLGAPALQKRRNGRHSFAVTLMLLPYYVVCRLNIAFWLRGKARAVGVVERVQLGSIVARTPNQALLDVCAEYPLLTTPRHYQHLPMLDLVSPTADELYRAAQMLTQLLNAQRSDVLVACALGYGRSAAVVMTWLVLAGKAANLAQAETRLRQAQPNITISATTRQAIEEAIHAAK